MMLAGCASDPPATKGQPTVTVPARAMADVRRGKLLYDTSCAECHSVQVHWREKRLVHDWHSLIFQVTRWQEIAGQKWRGEEIEDVAAYLNTQFYRVPCPVAGCLADRVGAAPARAPGQHGAQTAASAF